MGWDIGATGFRVVLAPRSPTSCRPTSAPTSRTSSPTRTSSVADIGRLRRPPRRARRSSTPSRQRSASTPMRSTSRGIVARHRNLSSASVLHVLADTLEAHPAGRRPAPDGHGSRLLRRDGAPAVVSWYALPDPGAGRTGEARRARRLQAQRGMVDGARRRRDRPRHYPFMVVLHTGLLVGCLVEVAVADRPFLPWLGWPMLALVLAAQALRWWCITTLGHAVEHPGDRRARAAAGHLAVPTGSCGTPTTSPWSSRASPCPSCTRRGSRPGLHRAQHPAAARSGSASSPPPSRRCPPVGDMSRST